VVVVLMVVRGNEIEIYRNILEKQKKNSIYAEARINFRVGEYSVV
jgi:hypothetical protein